MKTRLLCLLIASATGFGVQAQSAGKALPPLPARVIEANAENELLAGPEKPEDFPAWLAGMRTYRQKMQALIRESRGDMADAYAEPALQWAQRSFIQSQMMAHERYFYDPIAPATPCGAISTTWARGMAGLTAF